MQTLVVSLHCTYISQWKVLSQPALSNLVSFNSHFFADSNNLSWSWGSLHSQDLLIYKLYFTTSLSLIYCETFNLCHISRYIPLRERMTPLPGKRNQQIIAQLGLTKTIHQKRQNVLCMKQKLLEEWLWKLLWKRCNFYVIHFKQFF